MTCIIHMNIDIYKDMIVLTYIDLEATTFSFRGYNICDLYFSWLNTFLFFMFFSQRCAFGDPSPTGPPADSARCIQVIDLQEDYAGENISMA